MGCCRKTAKEAKHPTGGHANLAGGKKYEFTDDRIRACQKCDENFWIGRRLFCLLRLHRFGSTLWADPNAFVPAFAADEKNECWKGNWEEKLLLQ